jgi:hypothetical protein
MIARPTSIPEAMFFAINRAKFNGLTITYARGNQSVADVPANRGKSTLVVDDAAGVRVETPSNDFIVPARFVVLAGAVITPKEGDRVLLVIDRRTYTYELMTPPYDPSDHAGTLLRLHTKFVSAT